MKFSFVNFPAIKFKRPSEKTIDVFSATVVEKFDKYETEGQDWSNACFDAVLSKDAAKLEQLQKEKGVYYLSDNLLDALIDNFTLKNSEYTKDFFEILRKDVIKVSNFYKDVTLDFENDIIELNTIKGKFRIYTLSKTFPSLMDKTEYLETKSRHKNCHTDSVALLKSLQDNCRIATGYVSNSGKGGYYLHSWIEVAFDGKIYVIDTTRNIFIERRGYYILKNIKGSVYKISKETFLRDESKLNKICRYNSWFSKLYLANRHQALQVYKILVEIERKKLESDPLYQGAKHFHDAMVKHYQEKYKNKKSSMS